ncbi:hypothetical protein OG689_44460 [Kitasatospora sp. NBC_00240]|uniref:hypothetical protein n=1 Tax=Kitasatospora sp. NBC_00240 TaxID=2903567 RepID=UPI00225992AF|nr:hypothetical protein [Kitasatospora sp. NBC_00240]MCX5216192.1 hypothetical protein [Kitasatospora sp. NBC_00240]
MHTTVDPNTVMLAGDILTWATAKTNAIKTLVLLVAGLMVVLAVIAAYWRTKSWVATLVAFSLGALVLWGINNMDSLKTKVGSEVDDKPATGAPHVRTVPNIPGLDLDSLGRI